MSAQTLKVDNPFTGEVVLERPLLELGDLDDVMKRAHAAHREWAAVPLADRIALVHRFVDAFKGDADQHARDITASMGKPIGQAHGEINGMCGRASAMAEIAEAALADEILPAKDGFERWIARDPVGVVVVLAAWNYPLLIAINPVVAAVLAGNAVVLKHSSRTPRCAEQIAEAFAQAGAPRGLVIAVHSDHDVAEAMVAHPLAGFVSFTGSVYGGRRVYEAVAKARFIDVGLELGGKDPAYVTDDANFDHAVENLVEGAFYNAGQSCCGIERIYVATGIYERFLEAAVEVTKGYAPGDPMLDTTTLGPMAQKNAPPFLAEQVDEAKAKGARVLCGGGPTQFNGKGRFFAPTIVADTDHSLAIAREESFGPVVAIQKVASDAEAIDRMNDSAFGLTASVWTADVDRAKAMLQKIEAGTVFLNRCDFLDPLLAWTGVKDSGKGASLSKLGFMSVTRPKSYHLRTKV